MVATPETNKATLVNNIITNIQEATNIEYYQIDQPVIEADIINAIINTDGVLSMVELNFVNFVGLSDNRNYSDYEFDMVRNSYKGLVVGPPGSIFELRYPDFDIIGSVE